MTIGQSRIDALGERLHRALETVTPIDPLTHEDPSLSVSDAYAIQRAMVAHRIAAGQRVVGKKIGITSRAVMDMLGVEQPDFGVLLSGMAYEDGAAISASRFISPRAEGEIAFVMARDISGPGLSRDDLRASIAYAVPCFEIVDSRIRDWKITIADTVADNGSSGAFVLGDAIAPLNSPHHALDLRCAGMVLEKNGQIVGTGAGAAALGDPLTCVTWLANQLGEFGIGLKAGEVILSGSLSIMFPVAAGDSISMTISGLGTCRARFVE
ncbi:fumarylacetoacetate hydrolase family protein [Paraburkholderia sp. ZP32-5]|uniref:fumarylacetoacetate hydrolase family protein n=1 Tax=Paraburkholderia sp. ZP32-5 TaxID=2883245 RepID=UPI00227888E9|nr:fumarylacetoacetate hydrolase family protein [Paraburkholderia sp. ZP32-5]